MTENIKPGKGKVLEEVTVIGTGNYKPARKRDYNKFEKFGTSDKLASIYGELQTAENKDISNSKPAQSLIRRFTGEHAPGDSVVIDMDYNFNVPNWGINDFLMSDQCFRRVYLLLLESLAIFILRYSLILTLHLGFLVVYCM